MIRNQVISVTIEPLFRQMLTDIALDCGQSVSGYVRALIVRDLFNRGAITKDMLEQVVLAR